MTVSGPTLTGRRARAPYPRWWVVLSAWMLWGLLWSTQVALYSRLGHAAGVADHRWGHHGGQ